MSVHPVTVIVGATGGIGRAISLALSRNGHCAVLMARDQNAIAELHDEILGENGIAFPIEVDIRDSIKLKEAFEIVGHEFGKIDALVNSAGVGLHSSISKGNVVDWRQMFEVNVIGACSAIQEALKIFSPNGGVVVNIGSTSGHSVSKDAGMYAATKFALRAATEILRHEIDVRQSDVRVCMVSPGRVKSNLFGNENEENQHDYLMPEEIATEVLHLLSRPQNVEIGDVVLRPSNHRRLR